MKASRDKIPSVGLTVLYEPEAPNVAVVDIVFVAGMGGHPVETWLYTTPPPQPQPTKPSRRAHSFRSRDAKVLVKKRPKSLLRHGASIKSNCTTPQQPPLSAIHECAGEAERENPGPEPEVVYWPLDLLPDSCPSTRILTWSCNAVTVNGRMPRVQNDIFAHADDLLLDLALLRDGTDTALRPIIFIAHSLGGVVVKEVLRRSEADYDHPARTLLPSTAAVFFLACPHRATELGKLPDALRSMAGVCLDVPPANCELQRLTGSTGFEVEVGREAFVRMWNDWNFGVRCFREGRGVDEGRGGDGRGFEVRRAASSIGDPREHTETFDASHLDICKFRSSEDPKYRILHTSLSSYTLNETLKRRQLNQKEKDCLRAILPDHAHRDPLPISYPGTCLWLYDIPAFQSWHHRHPGFKDKLLWIKGKPGSGKSVLLRSLRNRVEKQWSHAGNAVVWATAEGGDLDTVFYLPCRSRQGANPAGVYRSLLGQLFPHDPKLRRAMVTLLGRKKAGAGAGDGLGLGLGDDGESPVLSDAEIVTFFLEDYIDQRIETPLKRTFIFVDMADDSPPSYVNGLLSHLSQLALNSDFTVCIASNDYASVSHPNALEVVMRDHNMGDIVRYVSLNLLAEWGDRNSTVHFVAGKSDGVFLWAEIVVNVLNAAIEEGAMQELVDDTIAELPGDIDGLYEWILGTLSPADKADCLALMRWTILAPEPLRLNDLCVAVRLTRPWDPSRPPSAALDVVDPPTSLRHIRRPGGATFDSPYQFHRFLRSRTVGLLELRAEEPSARPGGGVVHEPLGLRRVRVIHDSVRAFFLSGRGHACLAGGRAARAASFSDASHYVVLRACLDYLNLADFASLGSAAPVGGRGPGPGPPPALPPPPHPPSSSSPLSSPRSSPRLARSRRRNVSDQRDLVTSSYPFLQYSVSNLLYHLLSPTTSRHSLPQLALFRLLSASDLRLYRRWTALLLGTRPPAGPSRVLAASPSAEALLARYPAGRLAVERVLRALYRLAAGDAAGGAVEAVTPSTGGSGGAEMWSAGVVRTPLTPVSDKVLADF